MRAAVIERFGPPEVLRIASRPIPAPGPDQLLVRIVAAGVNPVDAQNRSDGSWAGIPLPATLGSDVQLARDAGAHVVAVASEARQDALRELGADVTLDYRHGDLWQRLRQGGRIDAVVDLAGGEVPIRGIELLAEGGALATVNTLSGDFELAVDKNLTLHGVLVRPDEGRLRELASLVDRGALRPIVSEEFALDDVVSAHRQIETGHTFGKLVVRVAPEPAV